MLRTRNMYNFSLIDFKAMVTKKISFKWLLFTHKQHIHF